MASTGFVGILTKVNEFAYSCLAVLLLLSAASNNKVYFEMLRGQNY